MTVAEASAGADRLPWLADELPQRTRRASNRTVSASVALAILAVAAASYWIGARSWEQRPAEESGAAIRTTVPLPQPRSEPSQPQVALEPQPEVAPVPMREVPMIRGPVAERSARLARTAPHGRAAAPRQVSAPPAQPSQTVAAKPPKAAAPPANAPLVAWPAWQSQGASGRIVRIGAFGSRQQAKVGWRHMVGAYPAVAHLKATVVETRNSRGRAFYRFQIGTTSQAHSEVLCQRMLRIGLSCAVVGLPWKPKGVER